MTPQEQKDFEAISNLHTKADFEKFIYEKANGRLSRNDAKTFVSKMFRITADEVKAEKEQAQAVVLDWFKTVAGCA